MDIEKRNFKKFIVTAGLTSLLLLVTAAAIVLITDPFYQYHEPVGSLPVVLDHAMYQSPGAARNLEFDDVIIGTSMTENYHTKWFDEELGWNTVKLSFSGARSNDIGNVLENLFRRDTAVNHIFMDIEHYQLTVEPWTSYKPVPEYLYDANVLNDYKYLMNKDVIAKGLCRVVDSARGVEDNIDSAYCWEFPENMNREVLLDSYRERREKELEDGPKEVADPVQKQKDLYSVCMQNLDNITPYIEAHPETKFTIYLPPYSMLYWEDKLLIGELDNILYVYKVAIERLISYENVEFFFMMDMRDIITDLDEYRDECHHTPEVNYKIFKAIFSGEGKVTEENLDEVLNSLKEFVESYDFDELWGTEPTSD